MNPSPYSTYNAVHNWNGIHFSLYFQCGCTPQSGACRYGNTVVWGKCQLVFFRHLKSRMLKGGRLKCWFPNSQRFFLNKVVRRINFFLEINVGEPEKYFVPVCPGVNQLPESVGAIPHQQILRHRLEVSWPRFVCLDSSDSRRRFCNHKVECNRATTNLTHARWWHGDFKGLVLCTSLLEWQVLRRASKIPWHRYEQSHAFKCIAWSCPSRQSASASLSGGWAHITDMNPQCQPHQLILLKCLSHRQEFRMMIWSAAPNWKVHSLHFLRQRITQADGVYRLLKSFRRNMYIDLGIRIENDIQIYM